MDNYLNPGLINEKKRLIEESKDVGVKDGYWVVVQNWSQCS